MEKNGTYRWTPNKSGEKKTPAEWCSYAILLMNVASPLIERVTGVKSFGEVKKNA